VVADFGGGTTDFSLIRVGPESRKVKAAEQRVLANAGLGIAGDDFDAKLIRHLVAPLLGRGSMCRLVGKTAPMPNWPYGKLEHWHQLSFLESKENMEALRSLRAQAIEPEKIENLIFLITEDLGSKLHSAVQRTKYELSNKPKSLFPSTFLGLSFLRWSHANSLKTGFLRNFSPTAWMSFWSRLESNHHKLIECF